jgi:parallel beta-helix repeat protein
MKLGDGFAQTDFYVTDPNGSGSTPNSFTVVLANAMALANSGGNARININVPGGLINVTTQASSGFYAAVNITSGTLTIRKDPAAVGLQGFTTNQASSFNCIRFTNSGSNTRIFVTDLYFEKFTFGLWFTTARHCSLSNCVFTDNIESVHMEACTTSTVTGNTFNESAGNTTVLNGGLHILFYDNDLDINNNQFQVLANSTNNYAATSMFLAPYSSGLFGSDVENIKYWGNTFNNCKWGIYSDLYASGDVYGSAINFSITNNSFIGNEEHLFIKNPVSTTTLNFNTFSGCRQTDISLDFEPDKDFYISNYGLSLVKKPFTGYDFNGSNNFLGTSAPTYTCIKVFRTGAINTTSTSYGAGNFVNIFGQNLKGKVTVEGVKKVSVRTSSIQSNVLNLPIDLLGVWGPTVSTTISAGNNAIDKPISVSASYGAGNILSMACAINSVIGNQLAFSNGPFTIDYFKCNSNGDLVQHLDSQMVNIATGVPISGSGVPLLGVNPGDKVGVTVTSYGTNSNNPVGTSEVAYANISYNFSIPPVSGGCVGSALNLAVSGPFQTGYTYSWNFGDGNTLNSGPNVSHIYTNTGNYNVSCVINVPGNSPVTVTQVVSIGVCQFIPPIPNSCVSVPVNLTVGGPGGSGYTYSWNFGDGNTGSGLSPSHSYSVPGIYNVVVTIQIPGVTNPVTVNQSVQITACHSLPLIASGCPMIPMNMAVNGPTSGYTFSWNFGDSSPTGSGPSVSHAYAAAGTYVVTLSVFYAGNPVPYIITQTVTVGSCFTIPSNGCVNTPITMTGIVNPSYSYSWNFGDGSLASGNTVNHSYSNPGTYNVVLSVSIVGNPTPIIVTQVVTIGACQPPQACPNCIGSFAPDHGDYMISLWVREDIAPVPTTYSNAKIQVSFTGDPTVYTFGTNILKNKVIDGWQRIEEPFNIPLAATHVNLKLVNGGASGAADAFFDDIRIFPKDGQMKTFVYDPITMRLTSVLDENNYATFYEYDEEGKLIRVKKETEKGILTIQESREGLKKN